MMFFFHSDYLLKLHCSHFQCSAVQWVPPWTARGRSAGKCIFPWIPPWRYKHCPRRRCRASWRQCGRTSCGAATLRPLNAMMGPEYHARCHELCFSLCIFVYCYYCLFLVLVFHSQFLGMSPQYFDFQGRMNYQSQGWLYLGGEGSRPQSVCFQITSEFLIAWFFLRISCTA